MFVCLKNFVCWDIIENVQTQILWTGRQWKYLVLNNLELGGKNWCRFSSCRLTFTHFRFISYSMTFWDRAKTERCVNKALWCVARGGAPKLPILYWMLSSQYTYNYKSSHFWAIKIYWQPNRWQWHWKWWITSIAYNGLYCSGSTQPLWLYLVKIKSM